MFGEKPPRGKKVFASTELLKEGEAIDLSGFGYKEQLLTNKSKVKVRLKEAWYKKKEYEGRIVSLSRCLGKPEKNGAPPVVGFIVHIEIPEHRSEDHKSNVLGPRYNWDLVNIEVLQ